VTNYTDDQPAGNPTESKRKSWRDQLPIHPAAEMFPPLSRDELLELGRDIQANGMIDSPAIWGDRSGFQLLDGRNRLDAIEALGIQVEVTFDKHTVRLYAQGIMLKQPVQPISVDGDPYAYVISANAHRRHLTPELRRAIIAAVLKEQPEKSDRAIAEIVKRDHKTVASVRKELEDVGSIPHVEKRTDSKGRAQPARKPKPAATEKQVENQGGRGTARARAEAQAQAEIAGCASPCIYRLPRAH
jgi:hypothetical protein